MRAFLPLLTFVGAALVWFAPSLAHASCPEGSKATEHTVVKGDTISGIAVEYGVSQASIERANRGLDPKAIRLGQKITVCRPKSGQKSGSKGKSCGGGRYIVEHEVVKGDTALKIAKRYDVSIDQLKKRNPSLKEDVSNIRLGQIVKLCAGQVRAKAAKACNYRSPIHTHKVLPGETLGGIAGRYGVRRKDIYRFNAKVKANPNMIRVGQEIRMCPNIAPREIVKVQHTVQSGENFGSIARKYGVTRDELFGYQRGKLENRNSLREGQKLTVYKEGSILPGYGAYDDDKGVLKSGVQLPPGKYYVVKHPSLSWGTSKTVRLIQESVSRYRRRIGSAPKVHVGDISKKGGGKFPPHVSHQHGRDVDVGYVLKGDKKDEKRFTNANAKNLDLSRTWALIDAFLDTGEVKYIFMDRKIQKLLYEYANEKKGLSRDMLDELFQYPRRRSHGLIRHSKGHVNHFHVRFYE